MANLRDIVSEEISYRLKQCGQVILQQDISNPITYLFFRPTTSEDSITFKLEERNEKLYIFSLLEQATSDRTKRIYSLANKYLKSISSQNIEEGYEVDKKRFEETSKILKNIHVQS